MSRDRQNRTSAPAADVFVHVPHEFVRPGRLHEDNKRRDRAEVLSGKREFLSHCWGLNVEERMSAGWGWSVVLDSIRYRFVSCCSSELAAKCNLAGAGVGSVVQVGVGLRRYLRVAFLSFVAQLGFRQRILTNDLRLISPLLHQPRRHRPTYRRR